MIYLNKHHELAIVALKSGDMETALSHIQVALLEHKSHPVLLAERATIFMYLKRKTEALEDLDLAIYLQPENPYRYSSRAYVKDFFGDTASAIEDYEKCIELDPEDVIARNNLGLLIEKQGNIKKAQHHYKTVDDLLAKNPDWQNRIPQDSDNKSEQAPIQTPADKSKENPDNTLSVAKNVFTKKSVFKEFIQFIYNGFKLKT